MHPYFQTKKNISGTDTNVDDPSVDLYDIKFTKMYLKVRRVVVAPSVMLNHAMALEKMNAKYPMKKVIVKPIALDYSSTFQVLSNVHHGIMPNRVVLAFVPAEAYAGSYGTNPFKFDHLGLETISVKVSSQSVPYSSPLEFHPKGTKEFDITEAYASLFSGIRETGNDINYKEYKDGYFIFAFDLTPDLCCEEHYSILKDGNMEVYLRFTETLKKAYHMITYLEFDNVMEITKNRNILVNYQ